METSGSTVSCAASGLNGTQSSETKSWKQLTVQATFESCTLNGLSSATVDNNSCNYVISGTTDEFGHGKVQLAGRDLDIKITATGGTYTSEGPFCSAYVGNGADLTVNGTYTIKAYEDKEKSEGAQIGFTINETTV